MDDENREIRKLCIFNGRNFNDWKFRVEIQLKEYEIETFLTKFADEYEETVMVDGDNEQVRTAKDKLKEELKKN